MGSKLKKEIASDLDTLRQDMSNLAEHVTSFLGDRGEELADDVKQGVEKVRGGIEDAYSQTTAKGKEIVRQAHLDGVGQIIEDTVRERPFVMLAIAAGLGAMVANQLRR